MCQAMDPVQVADSILELWDRIEAASEGFEPAQEVDRYVSYIHGEQDGIWYLEFPDADDVPESAVATLDVRVLAHAGKFFPWRQQGAWRVRDEPLLSGAPPLSELIAHGGEAWLRLSDDERGVSTYRIAIGQGFREASAWVDDQCNNSETVKSTRQEWPRERLGEYLLARRNADVEEGDL